LPGPPVAAAPPAPTNLVDRSTLSIIRGGGQYSQQARGPVVAAVDGQEVAVGDRVVTGADANLVLTFFEGSTFALSPGTDIVVQRLAGDATSRDFSLRLNLGTIWARVVSFGKPSATFEVASSSAVAVVRGSQIGARVLPDGTFQCWTREGAMDVNTAAGQQASLVDGETVVVQADGQIVATRPFVAVESVLQVRTEGPVWPLLLHPHGGANGLVAPGVVVSQTFGALVGAPLQNGTVQNLEVPANIEGQYVLILENRSGGDSAEFTIFLTGARARLYESFREVGQETVQEERVTGRIGPGARIAYMIDATVERPGEQDASLLGFTVSPPQPGDEAFGHAKVLVSPVELQLAGADTLR